MNTERLLEHKQSHDQPQKLAFLLPHWIGEPYVTLSPIEPWVFDVLLVMWIYIMY